MWMPIGLLSCPLHGRSVCERSLNEQTPTSPFSSSMFCSTRELSGDPQLDISNRGKKTCYTDTNSGTLYLDFCQIGSKDLDRKLGQEEDEE